MLKLYGFAASNYYNMVKLGLLMKGVPFEEVPYHSCQNPDILAISPRGKVPILETDQGFLSETDVILDWIELTQAGPALLPSEPFARAKVKALAKEIELYIELPARSCYAEVFFGGAPRPEAIKAKARRDLVAGFASLGRHGSFDPYVAGEHFTVADLFFLYSVDLACLVADRLFNLDLLATVPKASQLLERLAKNPHVQKVAQDKVAEIPAFLARLGGSVPA